MIRRWPPPEMRPRWLVNLAPLVSRRRRRLCMKAEKTTTRLEWMFQRLYHFQYIRTVLGAAPDPSSWVSIRIRIVSILPDSTIRIATGQNCLKRNSRIRTYQQHLYIGFSGRLSKYGKSESKQVICSFSRCLSAKHASLLKRIAHKKHINLIAKRS